MEIKCGGLVNTINLSVLKFSKDVVSMETRAYYITLPRLFQMQSLKPILHKSMVQSKLVIENGKILSAIYNINLYKFSIRL